MGAVIIGGERDNVTVHARFSPPDRAMMSARGAFCCGRLRGEFDTLVESPERFISELERMRDSLSGEARWCGVDDDFDVRLMCASLGAIEVEAKFRDFNKFDAVVRFEIDQTYLPQIIGSLNDTLSVSQ